MSIENTDLERRVLAHEHILQAVIAHMAKSDPSLVDHLSEIFGDCAAQHRAEHDYTATASYAEQFIRQVIGLGWVPTQPSKVSQRSVEAPDAAPRAGAAKAAPSILRVRHRHGIWQVTRDAQHYGDYCAEKSARDAASLVLNDMVAHGEAAQLG
jgi:hypothetical protein